MDIALILDKLKAYLTGMWLYRWYGFFAAVILALLGWTLVASLPDRYQATTRVFIDTQSLIKPLMKDLSITSDSDDRVNQVASTIFNRPNLTKIAQMSDLDLEVRSKLQQEELLDNLLHDIKLRREGNKNLFTIKYEHDDPKKAKLVVQSILNIFVESTLSHTRTDTIEAQKFLEDQIDTYEDQLILAEKRLADFKREHLGSLPSEGKTYYDRLQQIMVQLEQARMSQDIAKKRRDEIEKQIRGEVPTFGLTLTSSKPTSKHPFVRKRNELNEELILLQTRFTDNHPDVINLLNKIEELDKSINGLASSDILEDAQESLNENPVYQQLKINLSGADAELATVSATVQELEDLSEQMRFKIDEVIDAETQLSNLNRDYLIHKQKYQALLERKEAAKLAEEMDDTQQTIRFRIIDPPYVPLEPVGPNRALFSLAVFMISVVFGLGLSFACSQLNPPYYHRRQLESGTGLPVLTALPSVVRDRGFIYRYQSLAWISLAGGLFVLAGLGLVVSYSMRLGPVF